MKILVITRGCWNSNNNTGNTMNNFFGDGVFDNVEIHNLYFRSELPASNPCKSIYQISEMQLIKSIFKRASCGRKVQSATDTTEEETKEKKIYERTKKFNLTAFSFAREIIWSLGRWKNKEFEEYLAELSPDIVFMPVYNCWYPHKVLRFIKKKTNAKVVLFHADDNYTLKHFSLSPLFWIYRFRLRHWVKKSEKISSVSYAISELQRNEYSRAFKKDIKLLYKGYNFDIPPEKRKNDNAVIKMVFTGNIGCGRYKSLAMLGRAINKINSNSRKLELDIYTKTPMTKRIEKALSVDGINLMGGVEASQIDEIQKNADILVHAEAFDLKNRLLVRQSFSTKIVDYLYQAKCIFVIGPKSVASVDYFLKNCSGIVACDEKTAEEQLRKLLQSPGMIEEYGEKAWECGRKNHNKAEIQGMLLNDFLGVDVK